MRRRTSPRSRLRHLAPATIVMAVLGSAASCRRPVGGACTYEPFHGICTLTKIDAPAGPGRVTVRAEYEIAGHGGVPVTVAVDVDAKDAPALRRHLGYQTAVPCDGQIETEGSCYPHVIAVRIAPAPVGCTTSSGHDTAPDLCGGPLGHDAGR